mmetsp:Transcript_15948/g.24680  ORF Transcript_15948/g.24680 Transcript_15948/m.24680 type:complete len:212 (+) Transcript_15948:2379-3014(+)
MGVKSIGDSSVLLLALVLSAEGEDLAGGIVVESQELVVRTEGVKDVLHDVQVELHAGHDLVLLLQLVQADVGQVQELFSGGLGLVDDVVLKVVAEESDELLLTDVLLESLVHTLALVAETLHDSLEKVHGLVLRKVSEVANIFLEMKSGVLLGADINHGADELLEDDHTVLGPSVLDTNVKGSEGVLPVTFSVQLVGDLQATVRGRVGGNN